MDRNRAQVGEDAHAFTQGQQTLLGANRSRRVIPLWAAHRAQHNGVGPLPYDGRDGRLNPDQAGKCFGCHKNSFLGLYNANKVPTAIQKAHFYNITGAGTGGTFSGVVRYFRERGSPARAVLVEPRGSIWGGGAAGTHRVEGIGNDFWPGTLDRSLIDEVITVDDGDSFAAVRALAARCGVFAGGSAGAAVHAAIIVAARLKSDQQVVTMIPDSAERYLSKGIFE